MTCRNRLLQACVLAVFSVYQIDGYPFECQRVKAAFHTSEHVVFIVGNHGIQVNAYTDDIEHVFRDRSFRFYKPITAAAASGKASFNHFLMSGTKDEAYSEIGDAFPPNTDEFLSFFDWPAIFSAEPNFHGIGAAVITGEHNHFLMFSGCRHVTVDRMEASKRPRGTAVAEAALNSDIGLPCDIDAAVYYPNNDKIYAIKFDKFWELDRASGRFGNERDLKELSKVFANQDICSS